jgi:hypothetical protein
MTRPRLVVFGIVGNMPVAGVTWQFLHFLEGLRRLGCDVAYVEDTGTWPYDPARNTVTDDCRYAVRYLAEVMAQHGFADRWAYRAATPGGGTFGMAESRVHRLLAEADALINVTGSTVLRDEHRAVPVRIYLETDPVLPQIEVARGNPASIEILEAHTHHFSYGENLGRPDCGVPVGRFVYRPTRQPIVIDWWTAPVASAPPRFTTIANWRQSGKDVEWNGQTYTWSKHHEFLKLIDLPRQTAQPLELALGLTSTVHDDDDGWVLADEGQAEEVRRLTSYGWRVVNALSMSRTPADYRRYIVESRGEFTVAKDQNVRLRSGWFSDRSACYLAAGRPVITQDTGFGARLPTGEGLFAFTTMDEILAALDAVNADYDRHHRAARAIAEECFRAETVLALLLEEAGLAMDKRPSPGAHSGG